MGHVYPVGSGDPVDIVAWWAEQARGPRGLVPHNHSRYVEGCFRCQLTADELGVGDDVD